VEIWHGPAGIFVPELFTFLETGPSTCIFKTPEAQLRIFSGQNLGPGHVDTITAILTTPSGSASTVVLTETAADSWAFSGAQGEVLRLLSSEENASGSPMALVTLPALTLSDSPVPLVATEPIGADDREARRFESPSIRATQPALLGLYALVNKTPDYIAPQRAKRLLYRPGREIEADQVTFTLLTELGFCHQVTLHKTGGTFVSDPLVVDESARGPEKLSDIPIFWQEETGDPPKIEFEDNGEDVCIVLVATDPERRSIRKGEVRIAVKVRPRGARAEEGDFELYHGRTCLHVEGQSEKIYVEFDPRTQRQAFQIAQMRQYQFAGDGADLVVRVDAKTKNLIDAIAATWNGTSFDPRFDPRRVLNAEEAAELIHFERAVAQRRPGYTIEWRWIGPTNLGQLEEISAGFAEGLGVEATEVIKSLNPVELVKLLYVLASIDWSQVDPENLIFQMFFEHFENARQAALQGAWRAYGRSAAQALSSWAQLAGGGEAGALVKAKVTQWLGKSSLFRKSGIFAGVAGALLWTGPNKIRILFPRRNARGQVLGPCIALVTPGSIKPPGSVREPIRIQRGDLFPGSPPLRDFDRGHLVADILGGPADDPRNFVPLHFHANRGKMRVLEGEVREHIATTRKPVYYRVHPVYDGSRYGAGSCIPDKIKVEVYEAVEANGNVGLGAKLMEAGWENGL
jgi:hypothetical protein